MFKEEQETGERIKVYLLGQAVFIDLVAGNSIVADNRVRQCQDLRSIARVSQ